MEISIDSLKENIEIKDFTQTRLTSLVSFFVWDIQKGEVKL